MYAIVHHNSVNSWISGIFQERELAIAYLGTIPVDLQPKLLEFSIDRYPIYLLEVERDFTYYRDTDITAFVSNLTLLDDDDWCYGNVYYIDRDWQSQRAGKNYMGIIPHIHLDNKHVLIIRETGITAYL